MLRTALMMAFVVAAAAAEPWQTYRDPTGRISVETPTSWGTGQATDTGFARIIGFDVPVDGVEFTISVSSAPRLPPELPQKIVKLFFPPDAELGEPRRIAGEGWNAIRQDGVRRSFFSSRSWLGMFYRTGDSMVGITLSGDTSDVDAQRAAFDRIVESVRFHAATTAVDPGKGT